MKFTRTPKNPNQKKSVTQTAAERTALPANGTSSTHGTNGGSKTVTIEAKIDVGFGNTLYMRGEGQGLSWNRGIPLTCVDSSTWKWTGEAADTLKFKLLLNDSVWSKGEDLVVTPGQKVEVAPAF